MPSAQSDMGFTPATAVAAEGARIGLFTCGVCGACVMHDPRDEVNRLEQHLEWHERTRST